LSDTPNAALKTMAGANMVIPWRFLPWKWRSWTAST